MTDAYDDIAHLDFTPEDKSLDLNTLDAYGLPAGTWGDILLEATRQALAERAGTEDGLLHMTIGVRPILSGKSLNTVGRLYDPQSGYGALVDLLSSPGFNGGPEFLSGVQGQMYSDCILVASSRTLTLSDGTKVEAVVSTAKSGNSHVWLESKNHPEWTMNAVLLGEYHLLPEAIQNDLCLQRELRPVFALSAFHTAALSGDAHVPSRSEKDLTKALILDIVSTYLGTVKSVASTPEKDYPNVPNLNSILVSTTLTKAALSTLADLGLISMETLQDSSDAGDSMISLVATKLTELENIPNPSGLLPYLGVPDHLQADVEDSATALASCLLADTAPLRDSVISAFPQEAEFVDGLLEKYRLTV